METQKPKRVEEMTTDEAIAYFKNIGNQLRKQRGSRAYIKGSSEPNVSYAPVRGGSHAAPMNNSFDW